MPTLTWDDREAIRSDVPTARYAVAQLRTGAQVQSEDLNWGTHVTGTPLDFFQIRNWPISRVALFTESDVSAGTRVAVLGQTVAEKLHGRSANAINQTIRIKNGPARSIHLTEMTALFSLEPMQTTLRIADTTYREAKAEAARLGLTLTRFIEEALRQRIATSRKGIGSRNSEIEERNRLMESLLRRTAHFRVGRRPTREEMNER